jgi:PAS domain S-box-containing protein
MADDKPNSVDATELLASLRRSEARLRGVLNSISDGFYAVGRDWKITEFNPAAEQYFRMPRENVVGRDYWELVGNASEEFKALLRAAMDGAPMAVLETQSLYRPDRYVELRIAATEEGICVALTDITDRRHSRERLEKAVAERTAALQASENRVRTILETTHLFQGLLEPDGTVLDVNAASLAAIGAQKRDVVGKKLWETPWFAATEGMADRVRAVIDRAARGETVAGPISISIGESVRSFDFSLRPVRDERGAVVALVPEANETTARVQAEEALRQAQKLEAVGQLTGGIAHDFNNLLMVISGGLNMIERAPERRDMLIPRMREAVERGANLTKQLLAFSRRQALSPKTIQLPDYFAGMADLLGRSLGVNVRVAIDVPDGVAPVMADPNALQLAILNLAVNARDAMNDSGIVIIQARNGAPNDAGAPRVSIAVADTGIGMSPEVRSRIFEPFFTTKEVGKGSGLGLAQVHGFVEQTGGQIDVVSTPGQGTRITLILPRGDAAEASSTPLRKRARQGHDAGDALLVEDDDDVAALTEEMLSHLGWRVTRVASAEAALGAIDGLDVSLVFSDVMMPGGKNGIELAHALRQRRADLPILLASGYAESVKREAERAGLPLLSKPFDMEALAAAIDAARQRS